MKTCRVTVSDTDGIDHTAQVVADTLYEAVARGLAILKMAPWTGDLCEGSVRVAVQDTPIEHNVRLHEFKKWLARPGGSPKEVTQRQRVREILGLHDGVR